MFLPLLFSTLSSLCARLPVPKHIYTPFKALTSAANPTKAPKHIYNPSHITKRRDSEISLEPDLSEADDEEWVEVDLYEHEDGNMLDYTRPRRRKAADGLARRGFDRWMERYQRLFLMCEERGENTAWWDFGYRKLPWKTNRVSSLHKATTEFARNS